jgi:hypothetical protein
MSDLIKNINVNTLNLLKNKTYLVKVIIISIMILIIFGILISIYKISHLNNNNCNKLENVYKSFPKISSINTSLDLFKYNLRDYYIKTSYNSCSAGNFKSDFVNVCALKNVIKQGVRCLDFGIYSLNDKPVISTSSVSDYYTKETYNSIEFGDAMSIISNYAFSGGTCPNPNDPLLLNFRIMSNNTKIYDIMANVLYNTLESRLLSKEFSYENNGNNLGSMPIKLFVGKIIIIVDRTNPLYEQTKLDEYVNIASGAIFMRNYTYSKIKNVQDMNEVIEFNKKNMSIIIPDLSYKAKNYSAALVMKYGCQLVAMSFQNVDTYMEYYTELFNSAGYAYILKPESLRFTPIVIAIPPPQKPELSYETREISDDYYNFNM